MEASAWGALSELWAGKDIDHSCRNEHLHRVVQTEGGKCRRRASHGPDPTHSLAFNFLLVITCVSALYAIAGKRRTAGVGVAFTLAAIIGMAWPPGSDSLVRHVGLACEAALFFLLTFTIGTEVVRNEEVTEDTLSGAACIYLLLGLAWTSLDLILVVHGDRRGSARRGLQNPAQ